MRVNFVDRSIGMRFVRYARVPKQLLHRNVQSGSNFADCINGRIFYSPLNLPKMRLADGGFLGQGFLAEPVALPQAPNPLANHNGDLTHCIRLPIALYSYDMERRTF